MYRMLTIGIILFWASAMSALFVRDVLPAWTAQDAPPMTRAELVRFGGEQQLGIFDAKGKRIGTAWSSVSTSGPNTTLHSTVNIEGLGFIREVLVETSTEFDPEGELDTFNVDVFGVPATVIQVRGERHGIYFPCEIQMGPLRRQANLDMAATRLIGEAVRPFNYLPTLKVGQAWRMQVIDPLSAAMGGTTRFTSIVARVTGRETIDGPNGKPIECFVVETSPTQTKAWVGTDGRVYVQKAQVPMIGNVTVKDESFEQRQREEARRRVRRTGSDDDEPVNPLSKPMETLKKTISDALGGANGRSD